MNGKGMGKIIANTVFMISHSVDTCFMNFNDGSIRLRAFCCPLLLLFIQYTKCFAAAPILQMLETRDGKGAA